MKVKMLVFEAEWFFGETINWRSSHRLTNEEIFSYNILTLTKKYSKASSQFSNWRKELIEQYSFSTRYRISQALIVFMPFWFPSLKRFNTLMPFFFIPISFRTFFFTSALCIGLICPEALRAVFRSDVYQTVKRMQKDEQLMMIDRDKEYEAQTEAAVKSMTNDK